MCLHNATYGGLVNGANGYFQVQANCLIHKTSFRYYSTTIKVVHSLELRMHIYVNMKFIPCGHQ